jgi:hypothetical protein
MDEAAEVRDATRSHAPVAAWENDRVVTSAGRVVPVRATARRPVWEDLPPCVRGLVESVEGGSVRSSWSAGTGFTPGFASRLDLADGRRVFVKAASSTDDELSGWPLSDAYRDEARKLGALPAGIGAPALRWHRDVEIDGVRWVLLGFACIDGTPPRRPWRPHELRLVLDRLASTAEAMTNVPAALALNGIVDEVVVGLLPRLGEIDELCHDGDWRAVVEPLCGRAGTALAGDSVVHMDLRDDNVLIDRGGRVWFVDWNWPVVGAPWIDLVCVLLSAYGDGLDADALLADHPLTRSVPPEDVDSLLAVLWALWALTRGKEVPARSPHLRDHQSWYAEVTRAWLTSRLESRRVASPRGAA